MYGRRARVGTAARPTLVQARAAHGPVVVWAEAPRAPTREAAAAADLVLADELLDPRVEGLGAHLHGRRAVRGGRARRQLQRRRRLE